MELQRKKGKENRPEGKEMGKERRRRDREREREEKIKRKRLEGRRGRMAWHSREREKAPVLFLTTSQ